MRRQPFRFPENILNLVKKQLELKKKKTEEKIKIVEAEDPFSDADRLTDNASSDSDVKEQCGHARATAVKRELERTLVRIKKTLARIGLGRYGFCEKCGKMIDTDRLALMPTADLCIKCAKKEKGKK